MRQRDGVIEEERPVGVLPAHCEGVLGLAAGADAALHRAKREWRNRVVASHDAGAASDAVSSKSKRVRKSDRKIL